MKKLFLSYDGNGDGCLSNSELSNLLSAANVGNWLTRSHWVDGITKALDRNGDRCISWEEYCAVARCGTPTPVPVPAPPSPWKTEPSPAGSVISDIHGAEAAPVTPSTFGFVWPPVASHELAHEAIGATSAIAGIPTSFAWPYPAVV